MWGFYGFICKLLLYASMGIALQAVAQTTAEALIREGIRQHSQRNFDAAIAQYQKAIELEPENVLAHYEMAFSQSAKNDCKASIESSTRATNLPASASMRAQAWSILGMCRDRLGDLQGGMDAFQKSIELDARNYLTYFNAGVTASRMGQLKQSEVFFVKAIEIEPRHASSHYALSRTQHAQGAIGLSMLALLRYLSLEPQTARASQEMPRMDELFAAQVRKDTQGKVSIVLNPQGFENVSHAFMDAAVALTQANTPTPADMTADIGGFRVTRLLGTVKMLTEHATISDAKPSPAGMIYMPFFKQLREEQLEEAFVHLVLLSSNSNTIRYWAQNNPTDMQKLMTFLRGQGARIVMPQQR